MRRSLTYFWRTNLAIAGGAAVATAVLTGALVVGDSVRGSLRDLTLSRLGEIDVALIGERPFGDRAEGLVRVEPQLEHLVERPSEDLQGDAIHVVTETVGLGERHRES